MKILLAEDDDSISMIAKLALERIGKHEVTLVKDGNAAVDVARAQNFDVILLDGMMPGKDGMRVCKELKQEYHLDTPIIFLSAKSQETEIRDAIACGAVGYIQKPFDPKTISAQIDQILSSIAMVRAAG